MNERNDSIEKRLEHLEVKCRRLRLWCASVTGLLIVACAAAAISPNADVVRAKRFEAVDDLGRTAAVLAGSFRDQFPGAGLRVGDLERGSFALLQVATAREEGSSGSTDGIFLQMQAKQSGESANFQTCVVPGKALCEVANQRRAIVSYVEPEESSFRVETRCEPDCGRTLLEILAEKESISMLAHGPNGDVLFERP
jgi:hypothetical protein